MKINGREFNSFYKAVYRNYIDENNENGNGWFIAHGQMADGHLAYSRLDHNGLVIDDEECAWIQIRDNNHLLMVRI